MGSLPLLLLTLLLLKPLLLLTSQMATLGLTPTLLGPWGETGPGSGRHWEPGTPDPPPGNLFGLNGDARQSISKPRPAPDTEFRRGSRQLGPWVISGTFFCSPFFRVHVQNSGARFWPGFRPQTEMGPGVGRAGTAGRPAGPAGPGRARPGPLGAPGGPWGPWGPHGIQLGQCSPIRKNCFFKKSVKNLGMSTFGVKTKVVRTEILYISL